MLGLYLLDTSVTVLRMIDDNSGRIIYSALTLFKKDPKFECEQHVLQFSHQGMQTDSSSC